MKVVLTGGGTAGHVFPAVNVGKKMKQKHGVELHYIGNRNHVESDIAKQHGIPFYPISSQGLEGRNAFEKYGGFALRNTRGVLNAINLLKEIRPDFVFATGGFVSAPVLVAAQLLKIPYAVHEQNSVMGKVNRLFHEKALYSFHSFPIEQTGNVVYSGNPVRFNEKLNENGKEVVFVGGSGGSMRLNHAAIAFAQENPEVPCLLLTGKPYSFEISERVTAMKLSNLIVMPYADDMLEIYKRAAVLVCRSGAGTIFEIANLSIPSVFVPLPNSADDHQKKNALYFSEKGAALLVEQDDDFDEKLATAILSLWDDENERKTLKGNIERLAMTDSMEFISDLLTSVISDKHFPEDDVSLMEVVNQNTDSLKKSNE